MENDTLLLNLTTQTISIFSIKSSLNPVVWLATISACLAYGFGFLGNLLSLVVFYSQDEFRKISTGLLFLLITIANFFHLWTLTTEFLTLYNIALFGHVFFQCRLTYFIQNVSRAMSTFFMVTVAIDRLIRTEYPMLSKKICTRKNILLITMIYLIIFSLFWSFYIYPIGSVNSLTGFCNFKYTSSFAYFINYLHFPIRAILVCFIPIIIMLLANIRMLNNIRQSKRRITNGSTVGSSENTRPLPNISSSCDKKSRRMTPIDRMLFYMMLANILTFIISQVPFHIYMCIRNILSGLDAFSLAFIRAILLIWSSLYFGVAFYFYCLASPLFREKFKKIICLKTLPRSITTIPMLSR